MADRLDAIAEELGDLAFDRLARGHRQGCAAASAPDPAVVAEEKRLTRARRAVREGGGVLRRAPGLGGEPDASTDGRLD